MPSDNRLERAKRFARDGRYERAIVRLESLLFDHPGDPAALALLAATQLQRGRFDDAIERFEQLLAIDPHHHEGRFQLGLAQLRGGAPALALASWEPLLRDDPRYVVQYHVALALMELGRIDEARPRLEAALAAMPPDEPTRPQLETLLVEAGARLVRPAP